jgi:thioredoxin reductase
MSDEKVHDVVVVGGGAAGLSGALTLVRARRTVLVVDAGEPRNAPSAAAHGFLTRDGVPPAEILRVGRSEVEAYGGRFLDGRVVSARRERTGPGGGFALTVDDGSVVRARRVLLAGGLIDDLPPVPGIAERWGRDVLHCPYCHGWEVRDRQIGVLATGPMAMHMALLMGRWSPTVTLFRHEDFPLSEQDRVQLAARRVDVVDGAVAELHVVGDRLQGLRMADGGTIACEALVVTPRFLARDDLALALGAEVSEHPAGIGRQIVTGAGGAAAPGVWAAGNATDLLAQVVQAAGQGVQAGIAINVDLVHEEVAAAVADLEVRS